MLSAANNIIHKKQTGHSETFKVFLWAMCCFHNVSDINDLCVMCFFCSRFHSLLQSAVPFDLCFFSIHSRSLCISLALAHNDAAKCVIKGHCSEA